MTDIISKSELDSILESQRSLILDLVICTSNLREVINSLGDRPSHQYNLNDFIGHYVSLAFKSSAITICKLLSAKEKTSLIKLFNKLKNYSYSADLREVLRNNATNATCKTNFKSKAEIATKVVCLENKISSHVRLIGKIVNRRDTFYAHFDLGKQVTVEKLNDLEILTQLAADVYNDIYSSFYGSKFPFENVFWSIRQVSNIANFWKEI